MKRKKIEDIIIRCHKPATNAWYQLPMVRQAGFRWCLQLMNLGFSLPDFTELYMTLVENPTVSGLDIELASTPNSGQYRHMYCYVGEIPDDKQLLSKLVDEAIFASLKYFCTDSPECLEHLRTLKEKELLAGDSSAIPIKTAKSKSTRLSLDMQPSGTFPAGGVLWISVTDMSTSRTERRRLLEYANYAVVQALCEKLMISGDTVTIRGGRNWKNLYPDLPIELNFSIARILSSDSSPDWIQTDITELQRRLLQLPDVPYTVVM
ncbi:MAG: hypothetical protein LCH63_20540 [Candidatus Melainabacteria bacterium]|nr:hypothetical protein [Candidatus Melainabacteria bacterium]OPZ90316.1 MAG: hypothetical protein BWY75_00785 [bacterium ADurb.Bin425]